MGAAERLRSHPSAVRSPPRVRGPGRWNASHLRSPTLPYPPGLVSYKRLAFAFAFPTPDPSAHPSPSRTGAPEARRPTLSATRSETRARSPRAGVASLRKRRAQAQAGGVVEEGSAHSPPQPESGLPAASARIATDSSRAQAASLIAPRSVSANAARSDSPAPSASILSLPRSKRLPRSIRRARRAGSVRPSYSRRQCR